MDEIDLRNEIIRLKKRISVQKEENQLLKVKNRKLASQLVKKDKEIETLLNPNQISNFRKVFSERSVSIIAQVREQNEYLENQLYERDQLIRKLQNNIQITKCYSQCDLNKKKFKCKFNKICENKEEDLMLNLSKGNKLHLEDPLCNTPLTDPTTLIEIEEHSSKEHSGREDCNSYQNLKLDSVNRIKNCSPESDLDRTELYYPEGTKPTNNHIEIQNLQDHFFEMLTEINILKSTIKSLQSEQAQTKQVLQTKDDNIEKLAEQIEHLKLSKSSKILSARKINSASSIHCTKTERENMLRKIYSGNTKNLSKKDNFNMPKIIIIKEIQNKPRKNKNNTKKNVNKRSNSSKSEDDTCETY